MKCRHCGTVLTAKMIDLGTAPPSNSYLRSDELNAPEQYFPLRVLVCETCWLVQTEDFTERENLFHADYAYLSSVSSTWSTHVEKYAAEMTERFKLGADSFVVEIGSNDGCLLDAFHKRGIPTLGIEPTESTAALARDRGLTVIVDFFGEALGEKVSQSHGMADLIAANNVLAHVPNINDFVKGFARLLKSNGFITFEFPHLLNLVERALFDTIYHEHYSYLSLTSVQRILETVGLSVFHVEDLPTHGGSLRVFAQHQGSGQNATDLSVAQCLEREIETGLASVETYQDVQGRAEKMKNAALSFLIDAKRAGASVAGYGAAAKGNTFLNYSGIRPDLLPYVVDRSISKQNLFMPGSRIPIVAESTIADSKPDYIVILPWNISAEIEQQLSYAAAWGAKIVTFVPMLRVSRLSV